MGYVCMMAVMEHTPLSPDMPPGAYLRALRKARGYKTLDDFAFAIASRAAELGVNGHGAVSRSAVSHWENGDNPPGAVTLQVIDDLLDADGEVLAQFGFVPSTTAVGPSNADVMSGIDELRALLVGVLESVSANTAALTRLMSESTPPHGVPSPSAARSVPRRVGRAK
jgi:transcriptional regulator with XRE-family HTH domain